MDIAKILSIYFFSSLKFFSGPLGGFLAGYNMYITIIITVAGMMTSVIVFTFFGEWLKRRVWNRARKKKKKTFSRGNRRFVRIWKRYGPFGVAVLTPIILMPIGGTLILTSLSVPRRKIVTYMLISAIFWAIVETILLYSFGKFIHVP